MRRAVLCVLAMSAVLLPRPAAASSYDYSWALPEWRADYAAPKLADNRGFAVEATGDAVYVAGVAGSKGTGAGDLFLLRYDLAGALVWERTWGGFELDQAQAMAVDGDDVWVAGSRTTDDGVVEAALLRFTTSGDLVLARSYRLGVLSVFQGVAVHGGSVYVAGLAHPSRADRDLYVARLSRSGDVVWEVRCCTEEWDEAWDLTVDADGVVVAGYVTEGTSDAILLRYGHDGAVHGETRWGDVSNDEARAIEITADGLYVTGGRQQGRSTDVFLSRFTRDGTELWTRTTGGSVVGGGGYGVSAGERGVYVAAGTYDFPAGGDSAILRFTADGDLDWQHVLGLPGFWDWNFDVDVRDGRFYVAGVLWRPGAEWYTVHTQAYREDFPRATLTGVVRMAQDGATTEAAAAMDSFSTGDFLRWAQGLDAAGGADARIEWEGASDYGRNHGSGSLDTTRDPMIAEENSAGAIGGLQEDLASGNYALVRNYTGVKVSLLDGFIRARYYISHDRLIPQGGFVYVGEAGVAIPPPPV